MLQIQKWKTLKSHSASFFTLSEHIPIFTYWACCHWDCCHWAWCPRGCCHLGCCHWSCYSWSCCHWICCHRSVRALCTKTNVHKTRRWSYDAATCKITLTFWKAECIATKRLLAKPKTHNFVSLIGCPNNLVQSRSPRRNEHVRVSKVHEPSKNYAYLQKGSHLCDQRLFIHKAHCLSCKTIGSRVHVSLTVDIDNFSIINKISFGKVWLSITFCTKIFVLWNCKYVVKI